jgi:hypothetical protein
MTDGNFIKSKWMEKKPIGVSQVNVNNSGDFSDSAIGP